MEKELQRVALYEALSFEGAWEGLMKNWFLELKAPINNFPQIVVVPNEATIQFIKEKLLTANIALIGVRFFTPGTLRHFLANAYKIVVKTELRETLHLLMKSVAGELKDNPVAKSASLDPDQFVRLADLLETTGWGGSALKNSYARALLTEYHKAQKIYNVTTAQKITNDLYELSRSPNPIIDNLLLFGFSSKHWASYKLLVATVRSACNATVCFLTQNSSRIIDQAWLGSWEEEFGPSQIIFYSEEQKKFSFFSSAFEEESRFNNSIYQNKETLPEIYIAENILREAEIIIANISEALMDEEDGTRIGVVFPNQISGLAREVARLLEKEQIVHYNHLGYLGGYSRKRQLLELWIVFQKDLKLSSLYNFFDNLLCENILTVEQFKNFKKQSRIILQTVLTEDLELIYNYLKFHSSDKDIIALLTAWKLLPKNAIIQVFMELTNEALKDVIDKDDWRIAQERAQSFLFNFERVIKKEDFLLWFGSITKPLGRTKGHWGQYPYAKVHLITEEEALMQSWSYLILAGLNQGIWPNAMPEIFFLESKYIQELNFRSLSQGNQGDGHFTIEAGFSLALSNTDCYEINRRNFGILLGAPSKKIIVTAHKTETTQSDKCLMSEFLEKLYYISENSFLDEKNIRSIFNKTGFKYCHFSPDIKKYEAEKFEEIVHAYCQRRNINEAFDEYSFSFQNSNKKAFQLSCKAWEELITNPERAWFRHVLKIDNQEMISSKTLYALAKGTWVHSWINLEKQGIRMDVSEWNKSINAKTNQLYKILENIYNLSNRILPDIWRSYWHEARRITLSLCNNLMTSELYGMYLFSEYAIDNENENLNKNFLLDIPLKGRVDLIAFPASNLDSKDMPLWILDFKTGLSGALTKDKIKKGIGLQLILYALKFYKEGFKEIEVSILQPGTALKRQLNLNDILENPSILNAINEIYNNGKIGIQTMNTNYENSITFPLATLKVDESILERKWALTHPNLAL